MSILTGLYPEAHRVVQNGFSDTRRLSNQIPTLATLLSRAGYRCGAITAGGNVSPELGFDQGMETFDLIDPPRVAFERALVRMQELSAPRSDAPPAPFFLFLHTFEVHSPYAPSREYAALYADEAYEGDVISSREDLAARAGQDWEERHTLFFDAVDRNDPADVARLVDLYDASIQETDALLGDMLARARAEGLLDDTIVVLLSDHGEEFMEHGRWGHWENNLYDEILRVPLIIHLPTKQGTCVIERQVRTLDLMPTILDLAG
jgi:arylsulfatase A-like enzyme